MEEEEGGRQGNIHVTDTCSYIDARIGIAYTSQIVYNDSEVLLVTSHYYS